MILKELNCNIHRKIKPYQNFTILITVIILVITLTIEPYDNKTINIISKFLYYVITGLISIVAILSVPFIKKNKIGTINIKNNKIITYNSMSYNIENITFILNTQDKEIINSEEIFRKKIKNIPFWGNYIVSFDRKIEFLPTTDIFFLLSKNNLIIPENENQFRVKTSLLFKNITSLLWAAS